MTIQTSICILTYNRCDCVVTLLRDIQHLVNSETEIIVVDNFSNDNTNTCIVTEFKQVRYFKTDKNIGAAGRNVAFSNALGSLIICLDDDVFGLTNEMISKLLDKFRSNTKLGVVNFKVLNAYTGNLCNWVHHCKPDVYSEQEFSTYEITEGAVAFRKVVLDKSGYYDDIFFISHEGPDLAFRIMREGYDCIYWGDIVVRHRHENVGRVSWLNYYYDTRNHIYLAIKNFPFRYALYYLLIGLSSMLVYSIRDGYFSYWVKAIADGTKCLPILLKKRCVLPVNVMKKIAIISKNDAPLLYKLKTRLFKKSARL